MMFRLIRGKDDKKNPSRFCLSLKNYVICILLRRNTRQKLSVALEKQQPEYLALNGSNCRDHAGIRKP